jgi:membrane fusion protein, multidrug efflux system
MFNSPEIKIICCLILPAILCVTGGCSKKEAAAKSDTKPTVPVTQPVTREIVDYVYFTGRTEAVESVDVQARVTGYLQSIGFKPGVEVKKGDELFLIDPRPYQAALDQALGQVTLMEARLKLAIADYQRALEVANTPGAISKQDIDKYIAAQEESQASVAASKANSEMARLNVEFTKIVSPINGVVGRNLLTIGNLVTQDRSLLTTVVSQDPIYAYCDVDEQTRLRITRSIQQGKIKVAGENESIPIYLGLSDEGDRYPHEGRLDFINNRVDPSTGTLQIRGTYANPTLTAEGARLFKPGMFVRIRLPLSDPYPGLLVPEAAVGSEQGRKYLLTVNAENVIENRPVTLGSQQGEGLIAVHPVKMVRTKEGLQPLGEKSGQGPGEDSIQAGDRVIVGDLWRLRPGMRVEAHLLEKGGMK